MIRPAMTRSLLPWYEREPITLIRGRTLRDGTVLTFPVSSACPCRDCRQAMEEAFGPEWRQELAP